MTDRRLPRLLAQSVQKFGLALDRFSVLTEAASGHFAITPVLAAMGGARKVYALTRDSRYGSASEVATNTLNLAGECGVEGRIEVLTSREDARLREADIVTNLGFVRPIDATLLRSLKETVAVALMWETWEFRPQDLDLELCRSRGIPVLGTDEHHADLGTFGYVGHVVLKLLFELDLEVLRSRVVVLGSGEFAEVTVATLGNAGASASLIGADDLPTARGREAIQQADALVVLEHHDRRLLIGAGGLITAEVLRELNPALLIAHVCGGVTQGDLEAAELRVHPRNVAPAGYMSVSTAYAGPRPIVELHAAGLRVGQAMAEAMSRSLRGLDAERWALERCEYAQGFRGRH